MADSKNDLELDGSEGMGEPAPKRSSSFAALLPNLLKFAAIGLGALAFIVTVSVITYRILSGSGVSQTVVSVTEEYQPKRPQLSWFTNIGVIRTRTKDATPYSVVVNVVLGYDLDNKLYQSELTNRLYELKDFVRAFFSQKTAGDLRADNEERLKLEMREMLNSQILQDARVREILFEQLDVVEM